MQIKSDNYYLGQSSVIKVGGKGSDITASIKLVSNDNGVSPTIGASLSGIVKDVNGNGINGAVVKLMDNNLKPLTFAYTDSTGKYLINAIPYSSTYNLVAAATGKKISEVSKFNIVAEQTASYNFILSDDPNAVLGSISGNISVNSSTIPVIGAILSLYSTINNVQTLVQISYADSFGEFMFNELSPGVYSINVSALGYNSITIPALVQSGQVASVSNTSPLNANFTNSVISGVVFDELDNKLPNADVMLYGVDTQNNLTPISYTSTNDMGVYTFNNVPTGMYIVKSNQSQILEISPLSVASVNPIVNSQSMSVYSSTFDDLNVKKNNFLINNIEKISFDSNLKGNIVSSESTDLSNTAQKNDDNSLIKSTPKIPINSKLVIDENMNPVILSNSFNSDLLNNKKEENIVLPKSTPKIPVNPVLIQCKDGNIDILNESDSKNSNSIKEKIDLFMGEVKNGAILNLETNSIENLGGPYDGTITINYMCNKAATYNLVLEVSNTNVNLFVNVNNVDKQVVLQENASGLNKRTVSAIIPLNFGDNKIKIHGDGINYAPNLLSANLQNIKTDKIPLKPALPSGVYNVTSGELENGAFLNDGYVSNIGGYNNGSSTVKVIVDEDNFYDIKIYYKNLSDFNKLLKVDINGSTNEQVYSLIPGKNSSITVNLHLKRGINLIKFYGNEVDYSADLGIFTIVKHSYVVNKLNF